MQISLRDGIAAVTIARVAKEAGVSVGLVQHYFTAKDQLVEALYAEVLERANARIADIVAKGEDAGHSIRRMAADALAQLLPLDAARRRESQVRCEFAALALREPSLRAVAVAHDRSLIERLARVVENGKSCGEVRQRVVAEESAVSLLVAVIGSSELALRGHRRPAADALDRAVGAVFTGACRRHRAG